MVDINLAQVFNWWLIVLLFSFIGQPLVCYVCPGLRDKGAFFSRSLGWLVIGYIVWLAANLGLEYSRNSVLVVLLSVILLAVYMLISNLSDILVFLKRHGRVMVLSEFLFTASFIVFLAIRSFNPDLWHPIYGGEKFMELAYTNGILRSATFPPYDPYFAGLSLNYYYYGFYLITIPIQVTGIPTATAFNLAIATLFGMTVCGLFGLGYNLSAANRIAAGLRAVFAVVIFGNLAGGIQVIASLAREAEQARLPPLPIIEAVVRPVVGLLEVLKHGDWPDYDFWAPSRVISHTINEFPYWSFLFADLHPHVMAIPFSLLFLAILLTDFRFLRLGSRQPVTRLSMVFPTPISSWFALSWVLGTLAVINTWDLITYFALMLLCLVTHGLQCIQRGAPVFIAAGKTVVQSVCILSVGLGSYAFFYLHFHPAVVQGVGFVEQSSNTLQWFGMWGFWLVIGGGYLIAMCCRRLLAARIGTRLPVRFRHSAIVLPLVFFALWCVGFGFIANKWVCVLLLPLLVAGIFLVGQQHTSATKGFTHIMLLMGFLLLCGIEILFVKDHLAQTEYNRMNTVFKFGIHAWILLGLSTAVVWPELWDQIRSRWPNWIRNGTCAMLLFLLMLVAAYPILGTFARLKTRFSSKESEKRQLIIDGMAYMKTGRYAWHQNGTDVPQQMIVLAPDFEAIHWLQDNISGAPVLAEAPLEYYRAGGLRACSFTGLPTPIGFHQKNEQRSASVTEPRYAKTIAMWQTTDPALALQYLMELNVTLIYVGTLEKISYGQAALAKFVELAASGALEVIFQNNAVTIYRLVWK